MGHRTFATLQCNRSLRIMLNYSMTTMTITTTTSTICRKV